MFPQKRSYYGLWVVDRTAGQNPGLVGRLDTQAPAMKVAAEGEWIYLVEDGSGLFVIHLEEKE